MASTPLLKEMGASNIRFHLNFLNHLNTLVSPSTTFNDLQLFSTIFKPPPFSYYDPKPPPTDFLFF